MSESLGFPSETFNETPVFSALNLTVLFIGVHVKFCLSQKVMVKKGRILHIQLVTVKISSCSSRSSSLAASLRGWVSIN